MERIGERVGVCREKIGELEGQNQIVELENLRKLMEGGGVKEGQWSGGGGCLSIGK